MTVGFGVAFKMVAPHLNHLPQCATEMLAVSMLQKFQ
jgi:hypothetical protein